VLTHQLAITISTQTLTTALASILTAASIQQLATTTQMHSAITVRVLTQVATMPQRVTSIQMLLATTGHVSLLLTVLALVAAPSSKMHAVTVTIPAQF
jgi:hypothetical protein